MQPEDEKAKLLVKLEELQREEQELSTLREKLHERLDRGFANDAVRTQEREISDRRRELHRQIDEIRVRLHDFD